MKLTILTFLVSFAAFAGASPTTTTTTTTTDPTVVQAAPTTTTTTTTPIVNATTTAEALDPNGPTLQHNFTITIGTTRYTKSDPGKAWQAIPQAQRKLAPAMHYEAIMANQPPAM